MPPPPRRTRSYRHCQTRDADPADYREAVAKQRKSAGDGRDSPAVSHAGGIQQSRELRKPRSQPRFVFSMP